VRAISPSLERGIPLFLLLVLVSGYAGSNGVDSWEVWETWEEGGSVMESGDARPAL
jgi:hypothetical protein